MKFTTIIHSVRKELDISLYEYMVADMVFKLSSNPDSKVKGWFYGSRKYIADTIGVSKRTVQTAIKNLEEKKIIIRDHETDYLQVTAKWYKRVVLDEEKQASPPMKNLHPPHEESSPNNNSKINTLFPTTSAGAKKPKKKVKEQVPPLTPEGEPIAELEDYWITYGTGKGMTAEFLKGELEKFVNYYESVGWIVGRKKMVSWKATARRWLTNKEGFGKSSSTVKQGVIGGTAQSNLIGSLGEIGH